MKLSEFRAELLALAEQTVTGCSMSGCIIKQPADMAKNGGCRCHYSRFKQEIRHLLQDLEQQNQWEAE